MIWQDILLERVPSTSEIQRAIVAAGLAPGEEAVQVVDSMEDAAYGPRLSVACERTARSGQFPLQLSIYLYDGPPANTLDTVATFAATLGIRCLIADESENPYRMVLVTPGAPPEVVEVDVDALDEREEYILAR